MGFAKKIAPRAAGRDRLTPRVLTIAGSDSSGGAGIQADLRTFAAFGVYGASVVTCITAQNARRIIGIEAVQPQMVRSQLEAVFEGGPPKAIKTGMLYTRAVIKEVVRFLADSKVPLVVDPVLVSTSGCPLLEKGAIQTLKNELLPLATLVTPNIAEAETLSGKKIRDPEDMRESARRLYREFGCAALAKGGHLMGMKEALDIFYDGRNELLLAAPFVHGVRLHGTGCKFSAAIVACLGLGNGLVAAVTKGKQFISQTIANTPRER